MLVNSALTSDHVVVVRIIQVFDSFELRQKQDAPAGSVPPASWASGTARRPVEEIFPRSALTMYSTVSPDFLQRRGTPTNCLISIGRTLAQTWSRERRCGLNIILACYKRFEPVR